jgi:hypothetical protein
MSHCDICGYDGEDLQDELLRLQLDTAVASELAGEQDPDTLVEKQALELKRLDGIINGTDHFAGDPSKWGLRSNFKGAIAQRNMRDEDIVKLEAKIVGMQEHIDRLETELLDW